MPQPTDLSKRFCVIEDGGVEDVATGGSDGAYDLFQVIGTPEEIGKAIADSIRELDLFKGRHHCIIEDGGELRLTLSIRFCDPAAVQKASGGLPSYPVPDADPDEPDMPTLRGPRA